MIPFAEIEHLELLFASYMALTHKTETTVPTEKGERNEQQK